MASGEHDPTMPAAEAALAALGRRACPGLAETLIALAALWRPVDPAELDAELDQRARPLFAVEPRPEARATALAELIAEEFELDDVAVDGLWLDHVLAAGRGHPVLLAAVAVELGRRAGWTPALSSSPTSWYAGLLDGDRLWLVETTRTRAGVPAPDAVRRHCGHELAFAVLCGLAERFPGRRDKARARLLRDRLDLFPAPERPGRALLGTMWR